MKSGKKKSLPQLRRHIPVILALIVGFFGANAINFAFAHNGNTDLIHGCVKNSNGSIRIVGENDTCGNGESPLDWPKTIPTPPPGSGGGRIVCGGCEFMTNFEGKWVGQDFSNSLLNQTFFRNNIPDESEADMTGVKFDNSTFDTVSFQADTAQINLSNSSFASVSFNKSHFHSTQASIMIDLSNSNFAQARFSNTSDFLRVNAPNANFSQTNLNNGAFIFANLANSNFSNAKLDTWNFTQTDLTGATGFSTATLTNVTWENTTCPDGTNSDNNGNTCEGHLTP